MNVNVAKTVLEKAFMMFVEIFLQFIFFCVPDRSSSYAGSIECKQLMLGNVMHTWTCTYTHTANLINFYVFLTVHLSIILVINQLDAQNFVS